ncbi:MAG: hypothetical protein ACRDSH_14490, partial [Pseudonocardiaceae bacterium]
DIPEIMTAPHPPAHPDGTTRKTTFNLIQVAAAALAAVTTAVLSSSLGAAGTLIGAAGASAITTIATSLYQQSLERSRERVRSLARRTRGSPTAQGEPDPDFPPAPASTPPGVQRSWRARTPHWGSVALGALGAFLLAMLAVTSVEWASGETVGGNGKGTTIGEVLNDQPAPRRSPTTPGPALPLPATPTSTPTETPTGPPTESPTEAPTDTPDTSTDLGPYDEPGSTTTTEKPPRTTAPPRPLIPGLPGVGG